KQGLAYDDWPAVADFAALAPGLSWTYNYVLAPLDPLTGADFPAAQVEFVPFLRSFALDDNTVPDLIQGVPAEAAPYLLGFNEPQFFSQDGLSATQAAALWPQVEAIADSYGAFLISPSGQQP
ncbi:unnamed protein product, partial [Chrysoparadoxa australica]